MRKNKIGLALGSGGILGLAHIGVIKVLLKNNIKIDYISGSSVGAIVGAYFSVFGEVDSLEKLLLENTKEYIPIFFDFSLKGGFVNGNKINNFLEKILNNVKFSETKIPLFVVATDLSNGYPVFFSSGEIAPAVRGSISIPVFFKPFEYKNKLFVDGGISEPVPVDILIENGANKVIAVNLYDQKKISKNKITLTNVAMNSGRIILNNLSKMGSKKADVLLNPDVYSYADKLNITNYFKSENIKKMISVGEEEANRLLLEIKKIQ